MGFRLLACLFNLPVAVVYGSLSLFISILHNVFLLYYVDTFVSVYKIDKLSFWVGETVFLIWNSLNDPLFGWLSDRAFLSTQQLKGPVARNGPLFAMVHSWLFLDCLGHPRPGSSSSALPVRQLPHHGGSQPERFAPLTLRCVRKGQDRPQFLLLTLQCHWLSLSVFMSYAVWNKEDFFSFRIFCVVLAFGSAVGFTLATWLLRQRFQTEGHVKWDENADCILTIHLLQQEKRITLVGVAWVFHCHFNSNFFPLFLEHLLSDRISLSMGSFLLGVSYVAPHLNNLYFLSLCQRWGVYAVVRGLFFLKLLLGVIMLLAGPDWIYLLCFFIASNRVFTEGTCKLLNLVVTDLVDEDLVLNRRQQAASALLFGMVALVTKPGQTFAPLIGTWLLCAYTGYDIFQRDALSNIVSAQPKLASNTAWEPTLRQGCFYLLVFVPITCALLQLLSWSQFTLHGRHLQRVKAQRQTFTESQSQEIKTI
uniref:Major facilitator superfamily domain containing 13A n=1 Tax=Podarcis muralis TaxID=64176 RepID=A0A670I271_PODMU